MYSPAGPVRSIHRRKPAGSHAAVSGRPGLRDEAGVCAACSGASPSAACCLRWRAACCVGAVRALVAATPVPSSLLSASAARADVCGLRVPTLHAAHTVSRYSYPLPNQALRGRVSAGAVPEPERRGCGIMSIDPEDVPAARTPSSRRACGPCLVRRARLGFVAHTFARVVALLWAS